MRQEFENSTAIGISSGAPSEIVSEIEVSGLSGNIVDLNLTMDLDHSWTEDLVIRLEAPNGDSIILVGGEGGSGDNFSGTTFDDSAIQSIVGAKAPFGGTFRPEEALSAFNNLDPNGTWRLRVRDRASADGGALKHWSLSIEIGRYVFVNRQPIPIDSGLPSTIRSEIKVSGIGALVVADVDVMVDINHTWDSDLSLYLESPDGHRIPLAERKGGSGDDFDQTVFDDEAVLALGAARPPFRGRFRPDGNLSEFEGGLAEGNWVLEIRDTAFRDGGALNGWAISLLTEHESKPDSQFGIDVKFQGGLTASQRSIFEFAANRWSEIISGDLPAVEIDGEIIDDVQILADGQYIDGEGGILGQAGPTHVRSDSYLPARGIMSFDSADLARMEADGSLLSVIVHEMSHVLGFGSIWSDLNLLQGAGTDNPVFLGPKAMAEYATLVGSSAPIKVPVANTGGQGTAGSHWRESVFGSELLTGFLNGGENPISRMSIASFADMGYEVNMVAADPYQMPSSIRLEETGAGTRNHGGYGYTLPTDKVVLPPTAFVKAPVHD